MKVININSYYFTSSVHYSLESALIDIGVDTETFVPVKKNSVSRAECNFGMQSNVRVEACFNSFERAFFYLKHRKILKVFIDKFSFSTSDILHAHSLFSNGYISYMTNKKCGIPYVVTVRNTDINIFFKKFFYLRKIGVEILLNAAKVIFLSESYMRQCIDKYVPLIFRNKIYEKSVLIPNGIDKFWIDNIFPLIKRINPKNIKLIFAGNVNKNKNLEIVAKAAEYLNKRKFNIIFTIVGNVTNKKLAIKLQKYPCINLVGRVDKELLIEYYRSNDIFVMPSITESFGLVYLEAISQGLPVIYSRNQGFDGQFEEGTVGYAVSSKSVTEVVSVIKAIVNEYEKLSGNSYLIIERFDWHNIASQYYAVYKKEVCHD